MKIAVVPLDIDDHFKVLLLEIASDSQKLHFKQIMIDSCIHEWNRDSTWLESDSVDNFEIENYIQRGVLDIIEC